MSRDLAKTGTYLALHLTIGFTVAYLLTGSVAIAGGIALVEPMVNAVAFFFHEKAWASVPLRGRAFRAAAAASEKPLEEKAFAAACASRVTMEM